MLRLDSSALPSTKPEDIINKIEINFKSLLSFALLFHKKGFVKKKEDMHSF